MIDLSILFSFYSPDGIPSALDHLQRSAKKVTYEVILIGPNDVPESMLSDKVSYIKSFASPVTCMQLASTKASGEYIGNLGADVFYCEDGVDNVFDIFDEHNRDDKVVVTARYTEAPGRSPSPRSMKTFRSLKYWLVNNSIATRSRFIPAEWKIFNSSFIKTSYFREMGGLDCRFEAHAIALTDLGNRMQRDGATAILTDFFIAHLDNVPGVPPDRFSGHGPMYYAQTENDQPLYQSIYNKKKKCLNRLRIPYDNWKNAEDYWKRRKH